MIMVSNWITGMFLGIAALSAYDANVFLCATAAFFFVVNGAVDIWLAGVKRRVVRS